MRLMALRRGRGLVTLAEGQQDARGMTEGNDGFPGHLEALIPAGPEALRAAHDRLRQGEMVDGAAVEVLPLLLQPGKIVCVGLNHAGQSAGGGFKQPEYPTLFRRFTTSMIGHGQPMSRPLVS